MEMLPQIPCPLERSSGLFELAGDLGLLGIHLYILYASLDFSSAA